VSLSALLVSLMPEYALLPASLVLDRASEIPSDLLGVRRTVIMDYYLLFHFITPIKCKEEHQKPEDS
jgi:hypothetical protein